MPSDPSKLSSLMWHDVPNRGGRVTIVPAERNVGDVGLSSGWQGDNAGQTAHTQAGQDFVIVPIAKNADGSPIRGEVLGRIVNRSGPESQPILVQTSPLPYKPADLDTKKATLTAIKSETVDGVVTVDSAIVSSDWAWAKCDAANPFPGKPDPTQICLKKGFDPKLLYQVIFTAENPPLLGVGFAAFRDVAAFFKNETKDDFGTANPLAGKSNMSSRAAIRSRATSCAASFIWVSIRTNRANRCTTAHGPSSPGDASRSTSAGRNRTACWSCIRRVLKARNGGCRGRTRCANCPSAAFWIAAPLRKPAQKSSSISARPKCGR